MENERKDDAAAREQRKGEDIEERLLEFAARIGKVVDALPDGRLGRHIAGQIVRSGSSPAPNYAEACAAESKNDFVHKLGIVLKELRETRVWIRLIIKADLIPANRIQPLLDECEQLGNIIGKSLITAKANRKRNENGKRQTVNDKRSQRRELGL